MAHSTVYVTYKNIVQAGLHFLLALWFTPTLGEEEDEEEDEKPDAKSLQNAFWTSSLSSMNRAFFFRCSSGVPFSRKSRSGMSSAKKLSSTSEQLGKYRRPVSTVYRFDAMWVHRTFDLVKVETKFFWDITGLHINMAYSVFFDDTKGQFFTRHSIYKKNTAWKTPSPQKKTSVGPPPNHGGFELGSNINNNKWKRKKEKGKIYT